MSINLDDVPTLKSMSKQEEASEAFRAAWSVTKNAGRRTRRWVSNRSHSVVGAGKTLTVAALIITAALFSQYVIAAGLMAVFSMSFVAAWWVAIFPAMLLLLSSIGFAQEIIAAKVLHKQLENFNIRGMYAGDMQFQ
jgi:hypothetical protein